jgi:hypothetical protein
LAKMKNYNCSAEGEISYVSIWSDRRIRKMERLRGTLKFVRAFLIAACVVFTISHMVAGV